MNWVHNCMSGLQSTVRLCMHCLLRTTTAVWNKTWPQSVYTVYTTSASFTSLCSFYFNNNCNLFMFFMPHIYTIVQYVIYKQGNNTKNQIFKYELVNIMEERVLAQPYCIYYTPGGKKYTIKYLIQKSLLSTLPCPLASAQTGC